MIKRVLSMSLSTRIIALVLFVLVTVVAVNNKVFVSGFQESAEDAMLQKAAAFTAVADEAKDHAAALASTGAFDLESLLAELKKDQDAGKPYTESKIFGTIPVVVGWTAAQNAASRENIDFSISSFDARNPKNEPEPGSFDEKLLKDLVAKVESGTAESVHAINEETNSLHYMRAIKLTEECMLCHGHPGNQYDTDQDGKDPLGFAMESWKPGDMHGAYKVVLPLKPVDSQVASFLSSGLMWTGPMVVGAFLLFAYLMRRMFGIPMREIGRRMDEVASGHGDLTLRFRERHQDELGKLGTSFNKFLQSIEKIIMEVRSASSDVASAATQIAASSEEMAAGMNEQSQTVTQISSAIEEMSSSVVEVARKSSDAAKSASESGKAAAEGGEIVEQTIKGMQSISQAVSGSAASVQNLGKRGEQIGEIIEVINDIADQTNLLALNAAIEAARAGEHGRGFAVVADEVRKLADRTTKATEEIASSIQEIQKETGEAVSRMEAGTKQVETGVEKARSAGSSLERIVASANEVAGMIQSIAAGTEQQSAASAQVSRSIESISAVTRQASEGAGQAAMAAAQLSTKAEQLQALVSRFKTSSTT